MDSRPASRIEADRGLTTVQFVVGVTLALFFFVLVANLLVVQYAQGAVRSALEEAVRAGSRFGTGEPECQRAGEVALVGLLGGSIGKDVELSCSLDGALVTVTASGQVSGWIAGTPDFDIGAKAEGVKELG